MCGAFAKDLGDAMRALHAAGSVVTIESVVPMASLRELVRRVSDPDGDLANKVDPVAAQCERDDVWKRAVVQRKKFVTFSVVSNPRAENAYRDAEKKGLAVLQAAQDKVSSGGDQATGRSSTGGPSSCLADEFKGYFVSADLLQPQKASAPWVMAGDPDEKLLSEAAKIVVSNRSNCVVLAFDGCQRKARKVLEEAVWRSGGQAIEIFIVYSAAWSAWAKRKHAFTLENCEVAFMKVAVSRAKTVVKARAGQFSGAGESWTHFTTYTGVKLPGRASLLRILLSDKAKILGEAGDQEHLISHSR